MAWEWWSQSLGLLAVWLAVLFYVSRGRLALSLGAAALLFFAPIFQMFAFTYATLAIYAVCVLKIRLRSNRSRFLRA